MHKVSAPFLRFVHRRISSLQKVQRIIRVLRGARDANTDNDRNAMIGKGHGGNSGTDTLGKVRVFLIKNL